MHISEQPLLKKLPGHLIALLAGLAAPLGFAPFEFWPLPLLSCCLLICTLQGVDIRQAALRGWLFGVGFFGVGVSWVYVSINQFGSAPPWLAAGLTLFFVAGIALFFAIHLAVYRWLIPQTPTGILLGFPAVWVLAEWFRSWFLTGFPWIYLGYAPMDTWLSGWAPITGIYGLSFWSALTASALFLLYRKATGRWRTAAVLALLLPAVFGWLLSQHNWTRPDPERTTRLAMIQGNTPQNLKWQPSRRQKIINGYLSRSLQQLDRDLIIWPETAIPQLLGSALPALEPFEKLLRENDIGLITGIPSRQVGETTRYHNSVAGLGSAIGIYHKQRLVPFGEYVPLEAWLRGLIAFFDLPMSSFSRGAADQNALQLSDGLRLAAFICYEIVYPDLVAAGSRDADYLLTVSNDSWFGDSLAPHQHLQMARMRALENGRYLLRATNNGISAVIDPNGRITDRTEQFVTASLRAEVTPVLGSTPFSRFGSTPILLICALLAAALQLQARRRRLSGPRLKDQGQI